MKYGLLTQRNKALDLDRCLDLEALYDGGELFAERVKHFVPWSSSDNRKTYDKKLAMAKVEYRNYLNTCVGYYSGFLFANPINMRADGNADEFYTEFANDCDGNRTDFDDFLKERFAHALVTGRAYWAVEMPRLDVQPRNRVEFDRLGAGRATLKAFDTCNAIDFERDRFGALEWIILGEDAELRPNPAEPRSLTRHTFYLYTKTEVQVFEIVFKPEAPPSDTTEVPMVDSYAHGFGACPVVEMVLPHGLWLGEKLRGPQIANLHARLRLSWALNTAGYCVPVIKSSSEDISCAFGSGYAIHLGETDDFDWSTPPADAFEYLAKDVENTKDELFRISNLNFLGIRNNSMGLVRSAASRMLDADTGHIQLKGYASHVREAAERTYNTISSARNDSIVWAAQDFEQLDTLKLPELVRVATEISNIQIPSPTLKREVYKEIADKFGADLPEAIKLKIRGEIDSADDETVLKPPIEEPDKREAFDQIPSLN